MTSEDVERMMRFMQDETSVTTSYDIERALDSGTVWIRMTSGNYWLVRRNGATKRWARDPLRFAIPIKYGLNFTTRITSTDEFDFGFKISATNPNPCVKRRK